MDECNFGEMIGEKCGDVACQWHIISSQLFIHCKKHLTQEKIVTNFGISLTREEALLYSVLKS